MYRIVKRLFDFLLAFISILILSPVLLFLFILLKIKNDQGPIIFLSKRVGINQQIFLMPKFRTMRFDTPQLASHLLQSAESYLTPMGNFLRKSSLDELPQLYSILIGDMSFVGPRPALFNQDDLMRLRCEYGIEKLIPGLTGWAQIKGRDELDMSEKINFEKEYLRNRSFSFDLKIMFMTFFKVIKQENIVH